MSSRLSFQRRLWTAALWPTGIALTSWDYMWRTTPLHRSEETGSTDDFPPVLPEAVLDDVERRLASVATADNPRLAALLAATVHS